MPHRHPLNGGHGHDPIGFPESRRSAMACVGCDWEPLDGVPPVQCPKCGSPEFKAEVVDGGNLVVEEEESGMRQRQPREAGQRHVHKLLTRRH